MLKMRELRGSDTFKVLTLINKLGVTDLVKKVFTGDSMDELVALKGHLDKKPTKKEQEAIQKATEGEGLDLIIELVEVATNKLPLIEQDLNKFLGELTDTDADTIGNLPIGDYFGLIKEFFAKEELKSFLSSISSLMKSDKAN